MGTVEKEARFVFEWEGISGEMLLSILKCTLGEADIVFKKPPPQVKVGGGERWRPEIRSFSSGGG